MTPVQARALLALIADLYQLASTPEAKLEPSVTNHNETVAKEAVKR